MEPSGRKRGPFTAKMGAFTLWTRAELSSAHEATELPHPTGTLEQAPRL
jgi:hypothetical protein